MASHASMSNAYDAFLFESLGIEENGMDLSVLSALARAGVDPWAEAKKFAALPRQRAIVAISAVLNLGADDETARHLAELLPRAAASVEVATTQKLMDRQALFRKYGLAVIVAWLAVAVVFMMVNGPANPGAAVPVTAKTATTR